MKEWGNMTDRKRNKHDPIGNPSIFHRKKSYKSQGIWMDQMLSKAVKNTSLKRSNSASTLMFSSAKKISNPKPLNDIWFNRMG